MKLKLLILSIVSLLVACGTAPKELPSKKLIVAPLSAQEQEALENNYLERMQNFLSGKLPKPKS